MSRGLPALGCADSHTSVTSLSRSTVSSIGAGPTLQLTPTTLAPRATSAGANCSGGAPSRLAPSSSVVICATMGSPHTPRTAAMAAPISLRSRKVSSTNRSTPPSSSAWACSRKNASASSTPVLPHGSMRTPSGPMAPATYAVARAPPPPPPPPAPPARLISRTWSPRPKARSFMRLAPKVLVSTTSAPARRYCWCTSTTRSGCVRLSDSKHRLMKMPLPYSIVPIAPSHTRTRSSSASRNGFRAAPFRERRRGRAVRSCPR